MGYNLHITRKEFWSDEDGEAISFEEWKEYVVVDPDIESDPENPGPKNYIIVSHPEQWPLWYRRGEIDTKNPDEAVVAKLVQIAHALGARVLGDDDEIYGLDPTNPSIFQQR